MIAFVMIVRDVLGQGLPEVLAHECLVVAVVDSANAIVRAPLRAP